MLKESPVTFWDYEFSVDAAKIICFVPKLLRSET